jgi:hypothetical protein
MAILLLEQVHGGGKGPNNNAAPVSGGKNRLEDDIRLVMPEFSKNRST